MSALYDGWSTQTRVIKALMIRELTTRFGRENIGFLWVMVEPLLFAILVGIMWTIIKGPEEYGVGIMAFVASGYIPLTFLRHSFGRCTSVFTINSSLMYHRQIKLMDFVFVRVLIEFIGSIMAWVFVNFALGLFGLMPFPAYPGMMVLGFCAYGLFILSMCFVLAPLSEVSELIEKLVPVTTYIAIPISGTFSLVSWVTPKAREYLLMSPLVNAMEMIRYGLFGDVVRPYYNIWNPLISSMVLMVIGLLLCRWVRRDLVVE